MKDGKPIRYCALVAGDDPPSVFATLASLQALLQPRGDRLDLLLLGDRGARQSGKIQAPAGIRHASYGDFIADYDFFIALSLDAWLQINSAAIPPGRLAIIAAPELRPPASDAELRHLQVILTRISKIPLFAANAHSAAAWQSATLYRPEIVPLFARQTDDFAQDLPLIDRATPARLLIDGEDEGLNPTFIDAFLALDGFDQEVWSLCKEPLFGWMRPDFSLASLAVEQRGVTLKAIDIAILTGEGPTSEFKWIDYLLCGVIPLCIGASQRQEISALAVALELPPELLDWSPRQRIDWLLADPIRLAALKQAAIREGDRRLAAHAAQLDEFFDRHPANPILFAAGSDETQLPLGFLLANYRREIRQETDESLRRVVARRNPEPTPPTPRRFAIVIGWAFDEATKAATDPILRDRHGAIPAIAVEIYRPDVATMHGLSLDLNYGFKFLFNNPETGSDDIWSGVTAGLLSRARPVASLLSAAPIGGADEVIKLPEVEIHPDDVKFFLDVAEYRAGLSFSIDPSLFAEESLRGQILMHGDRRIDQEMLLSALLVCRKDGIEHFEHPKFITIQEDCFILSLRLIPGLAASEAIFLWLPYADGLPAEFPLIAFQFPDLGEGD